MEKIIEFGLDMIETNHVESLCPDRIMIKNFNAENPEQI